MAVQSKRGKIAKGYSLKDNNQNGVYYIWVWNPKSYHENKQDIMREREKKGNDHYGKASGWKCKGRYPEGLPELYKHLIEHYGEHFDQEQVQIDLEKRRVELEKKYEENLKKTNLKISVILRGKFKPPVPYFTVLRKAKRFLKQLENEE